jgi:hypothetical protein
MDLHHCELSDKVTVLNCNHIQYTQLRQIGLKTLKQNQLGKQLGLVKDDRMFQALERIKYLQLWP